MKYQKRSALKLLLLFKIVLLINQLIPIRDVNAVPSIPPTKMNQSSALPLSYIEQAGDQSLLTAVIYLDQYPQIIQTIQKFTRTLPLPSQARALIDQPSSLFTLLPTLQETIALVKLEQPILVAVGEIITNQTQRNRISAIRSRVLVPTTDATALLKGLEVFTSQFKELPNRYSLLGSRKDGQAWQLSRNIFLAAFPEQDYLRFEIANNALDPISLDTFSRSSWQRTPAVEQLVMRGATITAHLKPWLLKEFHNKMSRQQLDEALDYVSDPEVKQVLFAKGISTILNGELLMSDEHVEFDDITLSLQMSPSGFLVHSTISLTPEIGQALNNGVQAGVAPQRLVNPHHQSQLEGWLSLDLNTTFQKIHYPQYLLVDDSENELNFNYFINELFQCGPFCFLHNATRRPLGIFKLARDSQAQDFPALSAPFVGMQFMFTQLIPESKGGVVLALSQSNSIGMKTLLGALKRDTTPLKIDVHDLSKEKLITFTLDQEQDPTFVASSFVTRQSQNDSSKVMGEIYLRNLGKFLLSALKLREREKKELSIYQDLSVKSKFLVEPRSLISSIWLGEGEAPHLPQRLTLGTQGQAWNSPIRVKPISPQTSCMFKFSQSMQAVFYYIGTELSQKQNEELLKIGQNVTQALKCVQKDEEFRRQSEDVIDAFTQILHQLIFPWKTESLNPMLNDLCALKYTSACELITLLKHRPIVQLPITSAQCNPQPYPGDARLEIMPTQARLNQQPVTMNQLAPQLNQQFNEHQTKTDSVKLVEVGIDSQMTMKQIQPWILAMITAGASHIIIMNRKDATPTSELGRSYLQIGATSQSNLYRNNQELISVSPSVHHPNAQDQPIIISMTQANNEQKIDVKQGAETQNMSLSALLNESSFFQKPIMLSVAEDVKWAEVVKIIARACHGIQLVWSTTQLQKSSLGGLGRLDELKGFKKEDLESLKNRLKKRRSIRKNNNSLPNEVQHKLNK